MRYHYDWRITVFDVCSWNKFVDVFWNYNLFRWQLVSFGDKLSISRVVSFNIGGYFSFWSDCARGFRKSLNKWSIKNGYGKVNDVNISFRSSSYFSKILNFCKYLVYLDLNMIHWKTKFLHKMEKDYAKARTFNYLQGTFLSYYQILKILKSLCKRLIFALHFFEWQEHIFAGTIYLTL